MERLIDANKLIEVIAEQEIWNVPDFVYESIKNVPTVDAEPIEHGRWIPVTKGAPKEIYICNRCHRQIEDDGIPALISIRYPYCHCGAKMNEVGE